MIINAGFLAVVGGFCLMASLAMGAETAPLPAIASTAQAAPAAPAVDRPAWASASGQDRYGAWADLRVAGVSQRFRWIPPGTFTMGSPQTEQNAGAATPPTGKPDMFADEVQHQVTLTQGYWLADSTCTQALWQAVTGANPAMFTDSPQNPVEQVSWNDCQQFLTTLDARVPAGAFRLPSEAQWEYACRAGTTTAFSFGSTITPEQVNYDGNFPFGDAPKGLYRQKTVAVKSLPPSPWGLYEMHGNVFQWCDDWYGDYTGGDARDPTGPLYGAYRVVRGGSCGNQARSCRSAYRKQAPQDFRNVNLGFRIVAPSIPLPATAPLFLGTWQEDSHADDLMRFEPARSTIKNPGEEPDYACSAYDPDGVIWRRSYQRLSKMKVKLTGDRLEIISGGTGTYHRLAKVPPGMEIAALTIPASKPVADDRTASISAEAAKRAMEDQAVRTDPARRADGAGVDADNTAWMKSVIAEVGWPDAQRFGRETATKMFLFVQHSNDMPLMLGVLPAIEKDLPSKAVDPQDFALLFDRVQMYSGRPQRYGSQIVQDEHGNQVVWLLEDKDHVEKIRADIGLFPLATYLQFMSQRMGTIGSMEQVRFDDAVLHHDGGASGP